MVVVGGDALQPRQAEAGDAAKVRRWIIALVDKVTTVGLEATVDPVPGVADVHVPNDVGLRQRLPWAPLIGAPRRRGQRPPIVKSAAAVAVAATSPKSASPRPLHSCRAVANPAILSFIDRTVFMRDQGRRVNREIRLTVASFRWRWRGSSERQSPKEILNWTSDLPVPQCDWCFIADRVPQPRRVG